MQCHCVIQLSVPYVKWNGLEQYFRSNTIVVVVVVVVYSSSLVVVSYEAIPIIYTSLCDVFSSDCVLFYEY